MSIELISKVRLVYIAKHILYVKVCPYETYIIGFLQVGKNCTHSPTLAEPLWRPNIGCEHSQVMRNAFQQWRHQHATFNRFVMCQHMIIAIENASAMLMIMWKNSVFYS